MIRLVICAFALTLAVAFAATAAAQNAVPALRANVTVTGDVVRIGDLIENAGPAADVPIFRAPDLGTRGVVAADRVIEAAESHQLIGIDTRGLSEVVVARASRAITAQEISARIAQALEGQYGFGEARNILITFDRSVHTLNVESGASGELQVLTLAYDTRSARFDATLDLPSSVALRRQSTHFFGSAVETINAVTIERPLERGEVIKASDLAIQRRPKAEGPAITAIDAVAGLAARHPLRPGQALYEADLMKPMIVQRNDTVSIIYEAPGLTLTLRGQAQDAGALGDTIGVLNVQSKRVVQGIITGPGRVQILGVATRVVENAPQQPAQPESPRLSSQDPPQERRGSTTE
jgi:flagellar basal body P-ring formation protein FlgA